ncbi:MAG TPA: hypothetical protein VIL60_12695 [Rhodanobacter sp.]
MPRHHRFSFIATSALATGFLLVGCSGKDQGPVEPVNAPSTSASVAASPPVAMPPVAYVPEPVTSVMTTCNIESFDNASFQSTPSEAALSATHSVSGWVAAPQSTPPSFWLRLDDKTQGHYFQARLTPSIKRPDVAASARNPSLPEDSGFVLDLPVNAVPAGKYHLYLAVRAGGKISICDDGRQVNFQ